MPDNLLVNFTQELKRFKASKLAIEVRCMPSMRCYCGQIIQLGSIPSKHTLYMISETDLFAVHDLLHEADDGNNESLQAVLRKLAFSAASSDLIETITCPNCGRLLLLSKDGQLVQQYARESLPES